MNGDAPTKETWRSFLAKTVIATFISGSVVGLIVDYTLRRQTEEMKAAVQRQLEDQLLRDRSRVEWRKSAVAELLGPVVMQLERTRRAFVRWESKNEYIETKVIKDGNTTVRDLLLTKGHLIPADLLPDAAKLVEHYDRWLEEYERVRGGREPDLKAAFVFVGPAGYPFPRDAEERFRARFTTMWTELYGTPLLPGQSR